MIICSCKGTSDRVIHGLIRNGRITLEALEAETGAGSDCGSCVNSLQHSIDSIVANEPEILEHTSLAPTPGLTSPAGTRSY